MSGVRAAAGWGTVRWVVGSADGRRRGGIAEGWGWSSWVFQKIGKLCIFCNGRRGAGIC